MGVIGVDGSAAKKCSMYLRIVGFSTVAGSMNSAKALSDMLGLYFTVLHLSPVDSAFKCRKYTARLTPVQWTVKSDFGWRCWVQICVRCWLQLVGCTALLMDASNF